MKSQEQIEICYSKRSIHTVLHHAIQHQLDEFLINWSLKAYVKIPEWIKGTYYPSKMERLQKLQAQIDNQGLDKLVVAILAAVLHTPKVQTIQQCVGYLQAYIEDDRAFHRAKTASELLAINAREGGLYHIKRNGSHPATVIVNHWPLINEKLHDSFEWINDTLFNPPLIEPPIEVTDNHHCGYHTLNEPLLMGHLTMHDQPQNYKAINTLNQIEWVLDEEVLKEPERPSKPLTTAEQHMVFSDMANDSQFVYGLIKDNPFWLCWQYDSRGRMYSHGYHVNFQSFEYKKALLSFNKMEYLT